MIVYNHQRKLWYNKVLKQSKTIIKENFFDKSNGNMIRRKKGCRKKQETK